MRTIDAKQTPVELFPTGDCDTSKRRMEQIKNYIITLNSKGRYEPIPLSSKSHPCGEVSQPTINAENPTEAIKQHTSNILKALFPPDQGQTNIPRNILIFIHGGLNSPEESRSRSIEESYLISLYKGDGGRMYFPIFINWNSALGVTYSDQIWNIRQGKEASLIRGGLTAPLYFLSDAIQAVGRAPATLEKYLARLIKTKVLNDVVECLPYAQICNQFVSA